MDEKERAPAEACYNAWTNLHTRPTRFRDLPDWQQEKWRRVAAAGIAAHRLIVADRREEKECPS